MVTLDFRFSVVLPPPPKMEYNYFEESSSDVTTALTIKGGLKFLSYCAKTVLARTQECVMHINDYIFGNGMDVSHAFEDVSNRTKASLTYPAMLGETFLRKLAGEVGEAFDCVPVIPRKAHVDKICNNCLIVVGKTANYPGNLFQHVYRRALKALEYAKDCVNGGIMYVKRAINNRVRAIMQRVGVSLFLSGVFVFVLYKLDQRYNNGFGYAYIKFLLKNFLGLNRPNRPTPMELRPFVPFQYQRYEHGEYQIDAASAPIMDTVGVHAITRHSAYCYELYKHLSTYAHCQDRTLNLRKQLTSYGRAWCKVKRMDEDTIAAFLPYTVEFIFANELPSECFARDMMAAPNFAEVDRIWRNGVPNTNDNFWWALFRLFKWPTGQLRPSVFMRREADVRRV